MKETSVSKRAFLDKIEEYQVVGIWELATYLELTYGATKVRLNRYCRAGLVCHPMPSDKHNYCLMDRGVDRLHYLRTVESRESARVPVHPR